MKELNIVLTVYSILITIAIIVITIIILGGIYLLTYTRFYKNMIVQQKFFKSYNILSLDFINKVLFNNRLTFLKDNFLFIRVKNLLI